MHIESVPGVRWGEDATEGQVVIDLAELCAWIDVPCDEHNCRMIHAVIVESMLLLTREVTVELGKAALAGEGVGA